jgi:serine/threonine protein kinase/beta-lactam-binding protein with PASTA domain
MTSQARLVGGRYEEGDSLGRGGMADVRKGVDNRLGRTVAIKRLRVDLASDPTFQARFRREAQSAASLNHPSIVAVYDTGEEPDPNGSGINIPYIVMEYVAGKTLRDMIREGRKILPERALEITAGVLEALDYSHRAGIVHRDIKPANVMLNPYGAVKVMDFGIARAVADTSATMTQTAAVIGTAQYLSPEQARGETVDARSDLYSTGCLLYELLTGRPPFVGESPVSVAYQHVRERALPPSSYDPDISPAIDAVVLKALAKNRDERYQSAQEMRADIHRILAGQQVTAPIAVIGETQPLYGAPPVGTGTVIEDPRTAESVLPPGGPDEEPPASRKGRGFAYFLLGLAIVALAVGGYLIWNNVNHSNTPTTVAVPNLNGKSETTARAALEDVGLKLGTVSKVANDNVQAGRVFKQDPTADTQVQLNTTVDITVSVGKEQKTVPRVIGMQIDKAGSTLAAAKFGVDVNLVDSDKPEGEVVKQSPEEGSSQPVGTTITLEVSNGKVQVPDVTGVAQEQAEQALRDKGFLVAIDVQVSLKPPGTVITTDPVKGSYVEAGSKITLIVAKAAQTPTPSQTPTATESSTPPTTEPTVSIPPGRG